MSEQNENLQSQQTFVPQQQPTERQQQPMEQQQPMGQSANSGGQTINVNVNSPYSASSPYQITEKRMNKHVFVWVFAWFLGCIGADRFVRGQIGLGILKILCIGGCGIWALVDWIVALVKAYGSAFGAEDDVVFINGKYAR